MSRPMKNELHNETNRTVNLTTTWNWATELWNSLYMTITIFLWWGRIHVGADSIYHETFLPFFHSIWVNYLLFVQFVTSGSLKSFHSLIMKWSSSTLQTTWAWSVPAIPRRWVLLMQKNWWWCYFLFLKIPVQSIQVGWRSTNYYLHLRSRFQRTWCVWRISHLINLIRFKWWAADFAHKEKNHLFLALLPLPWGPEELPSEKCWVLTLP